ncbi:MAG: SDR family oxidoreductase [Thermoplasmata archaeon]
METGLRGARVLVTASSQGIGFGIAEGFVAEGARVVVNSSNAGRLEKAVRELRSRGEVRGVVADLMRREELDRLVDETLRHLGGIDTLVYVTGSPKPGVYLEQGYEEWEAAARLLVVSPAYLARRVADAMIQSGTRGRMVFLTSISVREPIPTIATSSVCRIAVAGLVRTLAREIGPKGIRVNGILPGFVKTGRIDELMRDTARRRGITPEQALAEVTQAIPLGRIGTVEEVAQAAIFLGSDLSSYVSGTMLPVDGALLRSVG